MLVPCAQRRGIFFWVLAAFAVLFFFAYRDWTLEGGPSHDDGLIREYVDYGEGDGGRWYIPLSWQKQAVESEKPLVSSLKPTNAVEAAQLALELAIRSEKFMKYSKIPLVGHQTWKNFDVETWPPLVEESVAEWLAAASGQADEEGTEMAYILWDDRGIELLMKSFEPELWNTFLHLPYNVEKADTFRVAVTRWFGGIYADVDVKLLEHPANWIHRSDLTDWNDTETGRVFSRQTTRTGRYDPPETAPEAYREVLSTYQPTTFDVGAIYGIEADSDPNASDYWRMGYTYPLQLTNWALATAPHHPAAKEFLDQLAWEVSSNMTSLSSIDPLDITGPPALTKAVISHCSRVSPQMRWNALTGLHDPVGGRGKVAAGDILVLPITGFSPGRGRFHNMGSQAITHPNARLYHAAAGSWRKVDLKVEVGKLCRTLFGGCRYWSKFPSG